MTIYLINNTQATKLSNALQRKGISNILTIDLRNEEFTVRIRGIHGSKHDLKKILHRYRDVIEQVVDLSYSLW